MGWFDGNPDNDILAGGDAAKDTPGMIGRKSVLCHLVVVLAAEPACNCKPVTDLDSLHRTYPHHGPGQLCIQFSKDRIAKAGGTSWATISAIPPLNFPPLLH